MTYIEFLISGEPQVIARELALLVKYSLELASLPVGDGVAGFPGE